MNMNYENRMNLAFDKPLEYKGLLLYPVTMHYYSVFTYAEECLDVSRLNEKNIRLLRLPYLEYMYEKSLLDKGFKNRWNMLICILNIVLGEDQPFDILRKEGRLYIKVYQRSEDYELLNKEYTILKSSIANKSNTEKLTKQEILKIGAKIKEIQSKMYNEIMISSGEFEEIRNMIMLQNDIKIQHYDAKTEQFLYEMKEKMKQIRKTNDGVDFEDLITVMSYCMHLSLDEIYHMTIRRFNRYLNIITKKDDYYLYKQLELSGNIKPKSEIQHWISHYEPKGKFDDILVDSSGLMSSLGDGDKI